MTKRLLILSFSPIDRDPRVLRQVKLFNEQLEVVTCGYGPENGVHNLSNGNTQVIFPADNPVSVFICIRLVVCA